MINKKPSLDRRERGEGLLSPGLLLLVPLSSRARSPGAIKNLYQLVYTIHLFPDVGALHAPRTISTHALGLCPLTGIPSAPLRS